MARTWAEDSAAGPARAARVGFVLLASAFTWFGHEFADQTPPNLWYGVQVFGIPLHYPLLMAVLLFLLPALGQTRRVSMPWRLRRLGLWGWTVGSVSVVALSLAFGILGNATELFADWRNLVVVALVAAATTRWLVSQTWGPVALLDVAIVYGILATPLLIRWAIGTGVSFYNVSIPIFFGPTLFMATFAALVALCAWLGGLQGLSRPRAWFVRLAASANSLLVVLSFRRSFWLAWGIGVAGVVFLQLRRRVVRPARIMVVALAILGIAITAFVAFGAETIAERLASFLPSPENEYATTNRDHLNDLLDALGVIGKEPVFGLGIGRYYETSLISDWKETSFEVHNAVLHVWLKFGLLGAAAYLGFHSRLVRAALRLRHNNRFVVASATATGIYLAAQFLATMVGTWPYGSFQLSVHQGVLIGWVLAVAPAAEHAERPGARGIAARAGRSVFIDARDR